MAFPIVLVLVVWGILETVGVEDSFLTTFGSGDLFAIAAMLIVVLSQEIERIKDEMRPLFLVYCQEYAALFCAVAWMVYGACKLANAWLASNISEANKYIVSVFKNQHAAKVFNSAVESANEASLIASSVGWKFAVLSILSLTAISLFALTARTIVWKLQ